ncbi:MAG: hypothetical protein K6E98_01820 [Lachnospiraceae bacterium]|nr:hypothetical protein [Lachnospiraceae bacterium]
MHYEWDAARAEYIKHMERIFAKHCSTTSYTNGSYRYPVYYRKDGKNCRTNGIANVTMKEIPSMQYKFGTHRMDIGAALIEILDFLESHQGEDFCLDFDSFYDDNDD